MASRLLRLSTKSEVKASDFVDSLRIFGSAKEYHGFRYTNMIGKARMTMKAALTFTCMNLKKLAKILGGNPSFFVGFNHLFQFLMELSETQNKMAPAIAC